MEISRSLQVKSTDGITCVVESTSTTPLEPISSRRDALRQWLLWPAGERHGLVAGEDGAGAVSGGMRGARVFASPARLSPAPRSGWTRAAGAGVTGALVFDPRSPTPSGDGQLSSISLSSGGEKPANSYRAFEPLFGEVCRHVERPRTFRSALP